MSQSAQEKSMSPILAEISLGELIDKITILKIKKKYLEGTALENTKRELTALQGTLSRLDIVIDDTLIEQLQQINEALWKIEDDIREQERQKNFNKDFIELARSVYHKNDIRAGLKKEINTRYNSAFIEEKSYRQY